ncbi:glycosyltransferase [Alicyclobacillus curvatus]|nr:glycosyltransferase [Alicyclobacillus curvatus]
MSTIAPTKRKSKLRKPAPTPTRRSVHRPRRSRPVVSVVIPVYGKGRLIERMTRRLLAWHAVKEVIVVANKCREDTVKSVESAGARVIVFDEALGHDTGRAIGALYATGTYVLFLDADINWTIEELRPFVRRLATGADVALNRYPLPQNPRYHHPTAVAKRALNLALDRPDLKAASMTTVPHAIRRRVIEQIGAEHLAVPPVFFTLAALRGYRIVTAAHSAVGQRNPQPKRRPLDYSVQDLILGDHAEALHHLITHIGARGFFPDFIRDRRALPTAFACEDRNRFQRPETAAAIVPASNEARTIGRVVRQLTAAGVCEVHVVDNGSKDGTKQCAERAGAVVHDYKHALGHDVPRAIGAAKTVSRTLTRTIPATLFLDADFALPPRHIRPFIDAVTRQNVDVALNHLTLGLRRGAQRDPVSTIKRFLNLMVGRPDLQANSPTAVPHALSQRALESLTPLDLAVPPRITVQSVLKGLQVKPVHYVDVVKPNRIRRINRPSSARNLSAPVTRLIIGDHLEALDLWLKAKGPRGGFRQPRRLDILAQAIKQVSAQQGNAQQVNAQQANAEQSGPQQVSAQQVSAQQVSAQPVNAQPVNAQPVNAQPVNAQPVNARQANAEQSGPQQVSAQQGNAQPVNARQANAQQSVLTNVAQTNPKEIAAAQVRELVADGVGKPATA